MVPKKKNIKAKQKLIHHRYYTKESKINYQILQSFLSLISKVKRFLKFKGN